MKNELNPADETLPFVHVPEKSRLPFENCLRKGVKYLLSRSAVDEVRQFLSCNSKERRVYSRLRVVDSIRAFTPRDPKTLQHARSFLFVCFGNIMRSPMCEALMKRWASQASTGAISISSAGLNAIPGGAAHPWAVEAAQEFGIALQSHKARLLTVEMVEESEAILAMDYQNLAQLLCRYPQAKSKAHLLGNYNWRKRTRQIRDPYYGGERATKECYETLETCIRNLVVDIGEGVHA